jgi:hypothetical protein
MTDQTPYPIRVSSNGRYFVDADDKPFFWLGDTAWPLFTTYLPADAESYLADRARKGFTVIQCVLAWGGGTGFEASTPDPNPYGHLLWLDNNPATPNLACFEHVDHLAHFAAQHGIVLAMLPTWGYYVNNAQVFNTENAFAYGQWLGERYKAQPNIVWVNGGDRPAPGFEPVYRALGRGLRAGDAGAHLISYPPCGWTHSSQWFHEDDWLDFNMIQTWTEWAKVYPAVTYDMQLLPHKPVVLAEGAYEGGPEYPQGPITPVVVRRQAWWAFMAGGYSTYGQDSMWRQQPGWTATFDTPGALSMAHLRTIVTSKPWWRRVPDQGLFSSGISNERTLNAAVRSPEGDWAMVYLATQCHARLHLDRLQARQVKATFVNPATGEQRDAGTFPATWPTTEHWFSTPGHWEDALIVLEAVS